ncbi:hypothetical protein VNO77_03839 [Canavalia gladiata]|uniref:Uncharacterized protein n=1 Tax=Canavalia gladiata TaxID=3824 RepID=A0AAN9R769_CANGL
MIRVKTVDETAAKSFVLRPKQKIKSKSQCKVNVTTIYQLQKPCPVLLHCLFALPCSVARINELSDVTCELSIRVCLIWILPLMFNSDITPFEGSLLRPLIVETESENNNPRAQAASIDLEKAKNIEVNLGKLQLVGLYSMVYTLELHLAQSCSIICLRSMHTFAEYYFVGL